MVIILEAGMNILCRNKTPRRIDRPTGSHRYRRNHHCKKARRRMAAIIRMSFQAPFSHWATFPPDRAVRKPRAAGKISRNKKRQII